MERVGDWLQTYTGVKFYPLDPRPEDINIEDIAHALSLICRFGGHCRSFYSVAQHSVLVSNLCSNPALGLMHDATEAYIGDVVRPLKRNLDEYRRIEDILWNVILERFNLTSADAKIYQEVKYFDEVVLATERRDLMTIEREWNLGAEPMEEEIDPLPWYLAEDLFLQTAMEIGLYGS